MPADFQTLARLLSLSAENRAITNIGNAGTDFDTLGGLTLASFLNVTGRLAWTANNFAFQEAMTISAPTNILAVESGTGASYLDFRAARNDAGNSLAILLRTRNGADNAWLTRVSLQGFADAITIVLDPGNSGSVRIAGDVNTEFTPNGDNIVALGTVASSWASFVVQGLTYTSVSAFAFQQATIISTTAGDLTLNPTDNIIAGAGVFYRSAVTATITASTTQTQGQGALVSEVNEISVCANVNDTVTLPSAIAGMRCVVINNGAQTLRIFPASGDNLGAGVDTATTLAAAATVVYQAFDATNWESI